MNNKTILVTGGTGSFGKTFVQKILRDYTPKKIIVFSRDEDKQHNMRLHFNNPKIVFEIGDVRDKERVRQVFNNHRPELVFHAAALKQVPAGEFFPLEVVKTNIIGSSNIAEAAIEYGAEKVIGLSTDKAAYPINAMGMSKALMEKVLLSYANKSSTVFCVTRYGNVMCSRGSIIPIWIKQAKEHKELTVTNNSMTRFLLSIPDAIDLVIYALQHGGNGELLVKKAPACTMITLAESIKELFNSPSNIKCIGIRHGEKMHETLITSEEMLRAVDKGDYYVVMPDTRTINYNLYFSEGQTNTPSITFASNNTRMLDKDSVKELLLTIKEVQDEF